MKVRTICTIDASPAGRLAAALQFGDGVAAFALLSAGGSAPQGLPPPSGVGGMGEPRECLSDQGRIEQRILEWQEPRRLCFEMIDSDMFFRTHGPRRRRFI